MKHFACIIKLFFAIAVCCPVLVKAQQVGENMGSPIVLGSYGGGTFSYADTKNNSGFVNDYGQPSGDIFYKFTVQGNTQITISHCGSGLGDTYMWLLNSLGEPIVSDDDNGPGCSGYQASIITSIAAGTYYIVSEGWSTGVGLITTTFNLTVQMPPAAVNTRNYIKVWEATAPETDPNALMAKSLTEVKHSVTYFDGLGRPEQSIIKNGSLSASGNTDLVSPVVYDDFGREAKKFLPYASPSSDGLYKSNIFTEQNSFYTGNTSPVAGQQETGFYSQTDFEPSPLNRPTKTYAPGVNWVGLGRGTEANYWINTAADEVRIWNVTDVPGDFGTYSSNPIFPATTATYPAGELYKNVTADETGNQVEEFKDKEGKVILKKVQLSSSDPSGAGSNHSGWLCTYYIYDDLSQLRAVIQPRAVEAMSNANNWTIDPTSVNELVFRYEYDERGRMIMKKIPGAGVVQMVYDASDRLVMTQDANLNTAQQWMVTAYENDLNRPVKTYLINDPANANAASHRSLAVDSSAYPPVSNYTNELMTETHYDDYTSLPPGLSSTLYNSGYGNYLTASSSSPDYAESITQSGATKGMVTWTSVKVLGTASQYILTVNIYDEKGRVIQAQTINATGGLDVVTNQYSFSNQLLRNHVHHQMLGATTQNYDVATKNNYDDLGRVTSIEKNLNDNNGWKTISELTYDALGQLNTKKLSPAFNSNAGLQTLKYDYNIRGWLLGMNRDYLATEGQTNDGIHFGFELGYDKPVNKAAHNFTGPGEFNGNIAGMVWKSDGDDIRRKYDFRYDPINRLLKADFEQHNGNDHLWNNTQVNYDVKMGDGITATTAYDANGNISKMQQWGLEIGGSTQIDNLLYTYYNGSNKLQAVTELAGGTVDHKLGDFTDKNTTATDYGYDKNGNLITDLNKRLNGTTGTDLTSGGAISYNYLNLPSVIGVKKDDGSNKGSITYSYDAAGNKLKKIISETTTTGTITTTTNYINGFIYESKITVPADPNKPDYADVLQFVGHEEGRIRFKPTNNTYAYDYFIKDHLGNVRMVLTDEQQLDQYPALSFDGVAEEISLQNKFWDNSSGGSINVTNTRVSRPGAFGTQASNGDFVQLLQKSTGAIGASKLLKVMSGDKIHAKVDFFYNVYTADNTNANGFISILTGLLASLQNSSYVSPLLKNQVNLIDFKLNTDPNFGSFFISESNNSTTRQPPKAYLHILLFNDQFQFDNINSFVQQVPFSSPNAMGTIDKMFNNAVQVKMNGYAYIYISNESNELVYFDNFLLTHERGALLEETHYYPFGLTMSGISSKAAGKLENNKQKFQGQEFAHHEFSDGSGLEMYEFKYRMDDPQTGRFWQVDPLAEKYVYNSTYAFSENKVTSHVELEGLEAADFRVERNLSEVSSGKITPQQLSDRLDRQGKTDAVAIATGVVVGGAAYLAPAAWVSAAPEIAAFQGIEIGTGAGVIGAVVSSESRQVGGVAAANVAELEAVAPLKAEAASLGGFPNSATVVRGGTNTPAIIEKAIGTHPSGIFGFSVDCGTCSIPQLSKSLPHSQIGVTTVGEVRTAGGDVIQTSGRSATHATVTNLSPEAASKLLTPTIKNPHK